MGGDHGPDVVVPAALAIFGSRIFWPGLQRRDLGAGDEDAVSPAREALARFLTSRPIALATMLICTAALVAAASGLSGTKLAFRLITGLPSETQQARASKAAAEGFAPGIVAPSIVLVEGAGLATVFLALNLVIGFTIVRILAAVTDQFISVYVLEDVTLVLLSAIQGFAFYFWLERG